MRVRYLLALAVAVPVIIQIIRWYAVMITTLVRGPGSNCPRCLSKRTRPSRPRTADTLFPSFVLPHRCENCQGRFLVLRSVNYARRARSVRSSRPMVPVAAQSSTRR
jgi:hypothetical protein